MEKRDAIILMDDEIDEVFGRVPSFIVRWGITIILGILLIVLGITLLIRYDDVLNGRVLVINDSSKQKSPSVLMKIPANGSGKIKPGQTVFIELDNFPATEFGGLQGEVLFISPVAEKEGGRLYYLISLKLQKGLNSDLNKDFSFFKEMQGTGSIIIGKYTLFRRLFRF